MTVCVSRSLTFTFLLPLSPSPQQLLREMQQMASRPFATINVALETDEEPPDLIGGNVKVSSTRFFFFVFVFFTEPSADPGDLPVCWADRRLSPPLGGVTTHHLGRHSRSRDDKYSLNHLLFVILADPGSPRSLRRLSDVVKASAPANEGRRDGQTVMECGC